MTSLQTGIAYTLIQNQVYALPAKASLVASSGAIEVSQNGTVFTPVTLTNGSAALASLFIRATGVGTIVSCKELGVAVTVPGEGGGASTGDVIIDDPTPSITIIDSDGDPGLRRWQIKIVGTDLQVDSQNDAGVSYGRPVMINLFNGGISLSGPISSNSALAGQHLGLGEMIYSSIPASALGVGQILNISDSTVNTIGATVAGGGAFHVMARYNGTVWKVIGV